MSGTLRSNIVVDLSLASSPVTTRWISDAAACEMALGMAKIDAMIARNIGCRHCHALKIVPNSSLWLRSSFCFSFLQLQLFFRKKLEQPFLFGWVRHALEELPVVLDVFECNEAIHLIAAVLVATKIWPSDLRYINTAGRVCRKICRYVAARHPGYSAGP